MCAVRVTLSVSGIVRAVHQSSSKLGDTPLARLDLFESLPSRGFAVEPLQQTLQQNRALHRSTTEAHRHAADVERYSSTALYISTALQCSTLYILYTLPQSGGAQEKSWTQSRAALSPNCEQSLSVYAQLFIAAPVVCVSIRAPRLTSVSH